MVIELAFSKNVGETCFPLFFFVGNLILIGLFDIGGTIKGQDTCLSILDALYDDGLEDWGSGKMTSKAPIEVPSYLFEDFPTTPRVEGDLSKTLDVFSLRMLY